MSDERQLSAAGTLEQASSPDPVRRRSLRDIATASISACVILALPVAYLVTYYGSSNQASADTRGSEAVVRSEPTAASGINLSLSYIRTNQPGRALPILNALVAGNPNNALAWNDICVAHNMLAEYPQAVSACNKAIGIDPNFQLARNNLRWAQDEVAKAQKSVADMEQKAPAARTATEYIAEGLNLLHIGSYDDAINAWRRALAVDPHSALAANNIGVAYMSKGEPKVALTWFQKALASDPTLQIAKNNAAWASDEIAKQQK